MNIKHTSLATAISLALLSPAQFAYAQAAPAPAPDAAQADENDDDPAVLMPIARDVVRRYISDVKDEDVDAVAEAMARNRSAVVLDVERTVTWDHTKLGGTY